MNDKYLNNVSLSSGKKSNKLIKEQIKNSVFASNFLLESNQLGVDREYKNFLTECLNIGDECIRELNKLNDKFLLQESLVQPQRIQTGEPSLQMAQQPVADPNQTPQVPTGQPPLRMAPQQPIPQEAPQQMAPQQQPVAPPQQQQTTQPTQTQVGVASAKNKPVRGAGGKFVGKGGQKASKQPQQPPSQPASQGGGMSAGTKSPTIQKGQGVPPVLQKGQQQGQPAQQAAQPAQNKQQVQQQVQQKTSAVGNVISNFLSKIEGASKKSKQIVKDPKQGQQMVDDAIKKVAPVLPKDAQGLTNYIKQAVQKHPAYANMAVGVLVNLAKWGGTAAGGPMLGLPAAAVVGMGLRTLVGRLQGEDLKTAAKNAAKVTATSLAIGALASAGSSLGSGHGFMSGLKGYFTGGGHAAAQAAAGHAAQSVAGQQGQATDTSHQQAAVQPQHHGVSGQTGQTGQLTPGGAGVQPGAAGGQALQLPKWEPTGDANADRLAAQTLGQEQQFLNTAQQAGYNTSSPGSHNFTGNMHGGNITDINGQPVGQQGVAPQQPVPQTPAGGITPDDDWDNKNPVKAQKGIRQADDASFEEGIKRKRVMKESSYVKMMKSMYRL